MLGEEIRRCLHAGEPVYGTHVAQTTNLVAAGMLVRAELDYVFICAEHMPLDRAEIGALCALYAAKGVSPIVRISHPSAVEAAKALDVGAQGIVAPYVETVEQVREVVGAVHYRPIKGKLLAEYQSGRRRIPDQVRAFFNRFNRHHYVIIGIESIPAYEHLEELISVQGVDGVFIGPHDLSVSMEIPEQWNHPDFLRVIREIVVRCRAAGVGVGVHLTPGIFSVQQARSLIEEGMNWVLDGSDVGQAIAALQDRRAAFGVSGGRPTASVARDDGINSCAVVERPLAPASFRAAGAAQVVQK